MPGWGRRMDQDTNGAGAGVRTRVRAALRTSSATKIQAQVPPRILFMLLLLPSKCVAKEKPTTEQTKTRSYMQRTTIIAFPVIYFS